jgi:hypothetical protein
MAVRGIYMDVRRKVKRVLLKQLDWPWCTDG